MLNVNFGQPWANTRNFLRGVLQLRSHGIVHECMRYAPFYTREKMHKQSKVI